MAPYILSLPIAPSFLFASLYLSERRSGLPRSVANDQQPPSTDDQVWFLSWLVLLVKEGVFVEVLSL